MIEKNGPLSHLRVLDLSRIMAGPWATQLLADLGAEVIKIERPIVGDDTRSWGPPYLSTSDGAERDAGYFLSVNRGKRSVAIDLASTEGQRTIRDLAKESDIVVENFKVGTLAQFGLDAVSLRADNPRLIYCSITGFGQDGPRRDQAAYDFAIQAMGGLMSITGERDAAPGGGPQKVGIPIVDLMTGMYAAVAVLAAIAKRDRSGEGETIDLAMLDVSVAMLANQGINYLLSGKEPTRQGNRHPNIQPQDRFDAADGPFVLAVGNDGQFAKLCDVLDRPDWKCDPRFSTNEKRVEAGAELTEMLATAFARVQRSVLISALEDHGVPCAPINNIGQVFDDPQVIHRQMLQNVPGRSGETVPLVANPIRYEGDTTRSKRVPPQLGADTAGILAWLLSNSHES